MRWSLTTSLVLHASILVAALVVLPNPNAFEVKPQPAIQVDISKIGDVSKQMAMTKTPEKPKDKPAQKKTEAAKKSEPAPKVAEKEKKAVKEAAAAPPPPEPKKEEPKKDPPKKEEPKPLDAQPLKDLIKDTVTETPEPKKEQAKKEEPKKAAEKPKDKPKKQEKKAAKLDVDQLEAFLNKVDESQAPESASQPEATAAAGEANLQGTDNEIVGTIVDLLVSRVKECWTVPPGAREANMSIRIHFQLSLDGKIVGAPEIESFNADPLFDATARSAVAALMECQDYSFLPKDRYDLWKDNTLDFNPNLMFDS